MSSSELFPHNRILKSRILSVRLNVPLGMMEVIWEGMEKGMGSKDRERAIRIATLWCKLLTAHLEDPSCSIISVLFIFCLFLSELTIWNIKSISEHIPSRTNGSHARNMLSTWWIFGRKWLASGKVFGHFFVFLLFFLIVLTYYLNERPYILHGHQALFLPLLALIGLILLLRFSLAQKFQHKCCASLRRQ